MVNRHWCSLIIMLGYFVGNQLDWVVHLVQEGRRWLAAAIFVAVVTMWLLWRRKHHQLGHLALEMPAMGVWVEVRLQDQYLNWHATPIASAATLP